MGSFFGGGTSTNTVQGRPLTSGEKRLIDTQGDLASFALKAVKDIRGDVNQLARIAGDEDFRGALQTFNSLQRVASRDFDQARDLSKQLNNQLGKAVQKLGTGQADAIRAIASNTSFRNINGVEIGAIEDIDLEATQQDIELINSIASDQIALGRSDIEDATRGAIEDIRNILTPSRGLRPEDSPILSDASRVAEQGLRQQGQLIRGVRASATQAIADRPFQRGALQLQQEGLELSRDQTRAQQNVAIEGLRQSGAQIQLGAAQTGLNFLAGGAQFATGRQQQAFANRQGIAGTLAQLPVSLQQLRLGVASGIQPNVGAALGAISGAQGGSSSSSQGPTFASTLGNVATAGAGAGALFQGLAAAGILSDRNKKNHIRGLDNVDMARVLQSLRNLGIARWSYKDEEPGAPAHIGPYAQDFHHEFGYGDQHHINIIDALGILFAGLKAVIARTDVLEDALDG